MNKFFLWNSSDTLISLACGAAWWEIKSLYEVPAKKIYLIEQNTELLNQEDLEEGISYFKKYYSKEFTTEITPIQKKIEEVDLNLIEPIDWILCFNSWHELENHEEILEKFSGKMRIGTHFLLEENLSSKERTYHPDCGKALFFKDEITAQLIKFGFELIKEENNEAPYLLFRKNF